MSGHDAPSGPEPTGRGRLGRDFLLLWAGAGFTLFGARVSGVAYSLTALWQTGSATVAGIVGFAAAAPSLLVQLPAGVLVDRWDRRRLMIASDLGCLLSTASVAVAAGVGQVLPAHLAAAAFVQAGLAVVHRLAERAGARQVVPAGQLPRALSRNEARSQGIGLLGLPVGSLLFDVSRPAPLVLAALAHAAALATLPWIRQPLQGESPSSAPAGPASQITEAARWIWRQPFLRAGLLLITATNVLFQALSLVVMVVIHDSGGPAGSLGVMGAVAGVGGILGAICGSRTIGRLRLRGVLIGGVSIWALVIPLVGLTADPVLIGSVFALTSFLGSIMNVSGGIYQAQLTPDSLQGRTSAVIGMVTAGAGSLGLLAGGLVLDWFGGRGAAFTIAALMAVLALASTRLPPLGPVAVAVPDRSATPAESTTSPEGHHR
ncbi:MFS transporter [Kitasatospora sp. NPDC097643]|uniref:MFS transporter n=1 Tax=Kitasatospora sp. NPDC097643 TaxID=3157230 RepID=UPI00331CE6A8